MTGTETNLLPATREDVVVQLNTLGSMTTSTEWERSALVYALTHDASAGKAGRKSIAGNPAISFSELASWGIVGLSDRGTVAAYHKYWAEAVADGLVAPAVLGGSYVQPDKEWPGFPKVPDSDDTEDDSDPYKAAFSLIDSADKKLHAVTEVSGLSQTDAHDLRRPLNDLEDSLTEARDFIDALDRV